MPRYEYKCNKCDKSFEEIHGIDENVDNCRYCGGEVRRVFHPVGIVFKGSGFYTTDSRDSGREKKKPPAKEKAESEKPAGPTEKSKKVDKEDKSADSAKAAK